LTTLADFQKTNLADDHTAEDYNFLLKGVLNALLANTETISATKQLVDGDCQIQIITPSGANRTVQLPSEATTNHVHFIKCASGATYDVLVKDDGGATTFCTLDANEWALCIPAGNIWHVIHSASVEASVAAGDVTITDSGGYFAGTNVEAALQELGKAVYVSTIIDGMKLIWNNATSISVGVGRCYAENGDLISVTSVLTASGLSLSNDTWYHVYVYLSGGTPAVEVVTTAPAAWKGTAYSKTGAASRRYVGSIRSGGSANVLYFVHLLCGKIAYGENFSTTLRVLSSGTATTETDIDCSSLVPVTSTAVSIAVSNNSGAGGNLYVASSGADNTAPPTTGIIIVGDGKTQAGDVPIDSNRYISYAYNANPGSGGLISVLGYYFDR
jgi:hypothetical protein